jgi:hypothetical protein
LEAVSCDFIDTSRSAKTTLGFPANGPRLNFLMILIREIAKQAASDIFKHANTIFGAGGSVYTEPEYKSRGTFGCPM